MHDMWLLWHISWFLCLNSWKICKWHFFLFLVIFGIILPYFLVMIFYTFVWFGNCDCQHNGKVTKSPSVNNFVKYLLCFWFIWFSLSISFAGRSYVGGCISSPITTCFWYKTHQNLSSVQVFVFVDWFCVVHRGIIRIKIF